MHKSMGKASTVQLLWGLWKLLNGLYGMTKGNELLMRIGAMLRRYYGSDQRTAYGRIIPPSLFVSILEEHGKIWQLDYHGWKHFSQPVPVAAYLERFGEEKAVAAAES